MSQAYRGLFWSKVDFTVKLIYVFVSVQSCRKRCEKGKQRGREINQRQAPNVDSHRNYFLISGLLTKLFFIGLYHSAVPYQR